MDATFLAYVAVNDGKIFANEFMTYVAEQVDRAEVDDKFDAVHTVYGMGYRWVE